MLKKSALGLSGLLLGCSSFPDASPAKQAKRPHTGGFNLLFINTDQHRFDAMSCAGNRIVSTPNLDRLAREGVRFTLAHTPQPMCTAARTSLHTGLSIHTSGCVATYKDPGMRFGNGTFDQNLAARGYHTEYHGRWHEPPALTNCYRNVVSLDFIGPYQKHLRESLGAPPKPGQGQFAGYLSGWPYDPDPIDYEYRKAHNNLPGNGFPGVEYGIDSLPSPHTYSAYVADQTIAAIRRCRDRRFSITSAFLHPHHPQYVARPYVSSIDPEKIPLPPTINDRRQGLPDEHNQWQIDATEKAHMRLLHARYYELVQEADHHIGRILDALDQEGLAENTLVIFTSDHGEMLGDHGLTQKFTPYQESIRIPLIMRLPGRIAAGGTVTHPVSSLDLFATIFDYLEYECPEQEGLSLRPLIEGWSNSYPEYTFSEMAHFTAFVSDRWKYVWYQDSKSPRLMYDLQEDPCEMNNLLADGPDMRCHLPQARRIHKEMLAWMKRINHPFRQDVENYSF